MDYEPNGAPPEFDLNRLSSEAQEVAFEPGFWRSFGMSFTSPMRLGRALPAEGGVAQAMLVALVAHCFQWLGWIVLGALVFALVGSTDPTTGQASAGGAATGLLMGLAMGGMFASFAALSSVFVALPIVAFGYWIAARLFGPMRGGYLMTLRSVYYGQAPLTLGIVPYLGGLVGAIWALVSIISNFTGAQRVSGIRATVAYFLSGFVLLILMMFVFMVASAAGIGVASLVDAFRGP